MSIQSLETAQNQIPGSEVLPPDNFAGHITLDGLSGYISAGGSGTRLQPIFVPHPERGISKALLPVGEPEITLIEHQINKLHASGFSNVVVGVGNHDNVSEHIKAIYDENEVHPVLYPNQLGTGGDLVRAVRDNPSWYGEDVYITNTDVLLDIDEPELVAYHRQKGAALTIALTLNPNVPNQDAYFVGADSAIIYSAEAGHNPVSYAEAQQRYVYRGSSTGALVASKELLLDLPWQPEDGPLSLYGSIVATALADGQMFAFNNGNRLFTDVGTVESWQKMQANAQTILPHIQHRNQLARRQS